MCSVIGDAGECGYYILFGYANVFYSRISTVLVMIAIGGQ